MKYLGRIEDSADATNKGYVDNGLSAKMNAPTIVTLTAPTAITLADNHEYFLYDVSDLTITFPAEGHWEAWIALHVITLASGAEVVFPEDIRFIGDSPVFEPSDIWEISIVDGAAIAGKVR